MHGGHLRHGAPPQAPPQARRLRPPTHAAAEAPEISDAAAAADPPHGGRGFPHAADEASRAGRVLDTCAGASVFAGDDGSTPAW
eukprot:4687776-Prymnesium_polylepis.1